MKNRFLYLAVLLTISMAGSAQTIPDSVIAKYDTLSSISDSLMNKIDTSKKVLIGQTKSTDTAIKKSEGLNIYVDENTPPVKKLDKRWFISPLLKFQAQEFGMLEKQRMNFLSDAHLLPFPKKANISVSASAYKNFTKNISMSADLGMSQGHITTSDSLISGTLKKSSGVGNATLYYNLLGGHYKLQPFLAAGVTGIIKNGSYLTAPVGAGVKFTSNKVMVEAQGAYGYAISKNIANNLVYSLGVYIPFKSKKQKDEEEKERKKKDSSSVNITNITNNYYLLNNSDSLKKVQDSLKMQKDLADKLSSDSALALLDEDDPMRLPSAKKYIIYFYYDQYSLTTSAFNTIDQVYERMRADKNLCIHLKGHTDQSGSELYNSPLSKRRAQMVFDYMNSKGIPAERMILSSFGKKKPAVLNEDPNTAWLNRRCEIVLFEKK